MTYSDNLEKLRQAGVIDMTLSFGCKINKYGDDVIFLYSDENDFVVFYPSFRNGIVNRDTLLEWEEGTYTILGHPLTIGRVLRWCDNKFTLATTGLKQLRENTSKILSLRHNKDLPLDSQENREEIAEFLVSLTYIVKGDEKELEKK